MIRDFTITSSYLAKKEIKKEWLELHQLSEISKDRDNITVLEMLYDLSIFANSTKKGDFILPITKLSHDKTYLSHVLQLNHLLCI